MPAQNLRAYVANLAATTASETLQADMVKLMSMMQAQNSAQSAQVIGVDPKDPTKFKVTIGGVEQTISYSGSLPKSPGGTILLNAGYGVG